VVNKINSEEAKSVYLENGSDFHFDYLVIQPVNEDVVVSGFFSESDISNIKGTCFFTLDKTTLNEKNRNINHFPEQVYADMFSSGRAERKSRKNKELKNFYLDFAIRTELGNIYLIAEKYYETGGPFASSTPIVFASSFDPPTQANYDDILVVKLNPKGEQEWARGIFKSDTKPSYNYFLKGEHLHILLNSGKNLTLKEDGRTKISKGLFEGRALFDIAFTPEGDVEYHAINENKRNTTFDPFRGSADSEGFYMLNAVANKRQIMTTR
jgi:hypothetical protein